MRTEPSERWVRGWLGDQPVVDTREPLLFWAEGFPVPYYAFAEDAFALGAVRESAAPERLHPFFGPHGEVAQWYALSAGERSAPHAAWRLSALPERIVVSWEPGVLDRWTEEDEEVVIHPRDPHTRVDALPSSRHIQVHLDGELLAESHRPVVLFETGLPMRSYLPAEDVRVDRLTASSTVTTCPYKGTTTGYWSFGDHVDIAWTYDRPVPAVGPIAGRIAFYDEKVDVTIDGVRRDRPRTSFSGD